MGREKPENETPTRYDFFKNTWPAASDIVLQRPNAIDIPNDRFHVSDFSSAHFCLPSVSFSQSILVPC